VTQVRIAELHSAIGTDGAFARGLSVCASSTPVVFVRFAPGAERQHGTPRECSGDSETTLRVVGFAWRGAMTMWHYYGGKGRLAHRYPAPLHDRLIEPFAGAAAYAMLYRDRDVTLVEKDTRLCALWRWLIAARLEDVLALPLVSAGDRLDALGLSQPAVDLIRHHAAPGARPGYLVGARSRWNERKRAEIARLVGEIKHWAIIEGDYTLAPDVTATWFIDAPYQHGGHQYRFGSSQIDYRALAMWALSRRGQVIVCEDARNTWLPAAREVAPAKNIQNVARTEVAWIRAS
jgi:hypothetical protein